jgi:hypothetical protein
MCTVAPAIPAPDLLVKIPDSVTDRWNLTSSGEAFNEMKESLFPAPIAETVSLRIPGSPA